MKTSQAGIDLIKHFEGVSLKAYPDPGTGGEPYTIGYGHTGNVRPGDTISAQEAEQLLVKDLERFEDAVERLITVPLTQNEFDALVSFTFNVGEGALRDSTLRKRLNAGGGSEVFEEELPRWNKGGSGVMEGLVRRRDAEVELATSGEESEPSFLERAALFYNEERHQKAAWRELEAKLAPEDLEAFKVAYRRSPVAQSEPEIDEALDVGYFWQRDNRSGQGERSCFSSSMAMALGYLRPEVIDGDDDWYLGIVFYFGDTVSVDAQVRAARSLGFKANFHMDGTREDLERQIDNDIPVPMGVLHKGPLSSPTGGGHYICLVGYNETEFIVHDPYGRMDLDNGGYAAAGPTDGKFVRYDKKKLLKRWLIASDHDGWWMELS